MALSLLVLFAASLLVRSLQKLMTQDFGYSRDHLVIARLDPTAGGYDSEKMKLLAEQLNLQTRSHARSARRHVFDQWLVRSAPNPPTPFSVPGFRRARLAIALRMEDYVGPDYFGVVGIPILAGRGIEAQDTATATRVAVVNQAMVKYFFAGQNLSDASSRLTIPDWLDKPITIVGVSRDAKDHGSGIARPVLPRFYMAFQQVPDPDQIVIEAQVRGVPSAVMGSVISQIKATDRQLPISFVETLDTLGRMTALPIRSLWQDSLHFLRDWRCCSRALDCTE